MKFAKAFLFLVISIAASLGTGCVTKSSQMVTPGVNGGPATTNTVTVVDQSALSLDCAALSLVGTPALIFALEKEPSARPIVQDIQVALDGALNGSNTNVVAQINGLVGGDPALSASILPLIQGASALEQQLLVKYGTNNAVIIGKAVLAADLNITTAALAAVPAK
jgi:hypothetical protein